LAKGLRMKPNETWASRDGGFELRTGASSCFPLGAKCPVRVPADALRLARLLRDNFQVQEISNAEFETCRSEIFASRLRD
jgi:hypothetical protein